MWGMPGDDDYVRVRVRVRVEVHGVTTLRTCTLHMHWHWHAPRLPACVCGCLCGVQVESVTHAVTLARVRAPARRTPVKKPVAAADFILCHLIIENRTGYVRKMILQQVRPASALASSELSMSCTCRPLSSSRAAESAATAGQSTVPFTHNMLAA